MGFEQNWKWSSSLPFLLLFRMPLFFFVSGFLVYKAAQVWDANNLGQLLVKKFKVQIIPTACFFFLFCAMMSPNFVEAVVTNFHSFRQTFSVSVPSSKSGCSAGHERRWSALLML
jgi:fucose 4-O-acetylase-like acetyltransferase